MLSNEDLAELLESTRDRVHHMGGDTPAAAGVKRVLNGLITMLREQAEGADDEEQSEYAEPESYAEPEPDPEPPPQPARRQIPVRLRRQQEEEQKPANPLMSPQYAGFFSKLIADQKPQDAPPRAEAEEAEEAEETEEATEPPPPAARRQPSARRSPAPAQSPPPRGTAPSPAPQYRGFFDALVREQKGEPPPSASSSAEEEDVASGNGDPGEPAPPPAELDQSSRAPKEWRDETATG